jgi:hypothetical protein
MQSTTVFDGAPGTTVAFTAAANTAYSLTEMGAAITDLNGKPAIMVLISIETNSARIAFGVDASATLGYLREADQAFQVTSGYALRTLTMANATAGSNFTVQITPFFANVPKLS